MSVTYTTPVREYMSHGLIAVAPDTRLDEALRTLEQRDVSCLPVVDDTGALAGIVSMTDLWKVARLEPAGLGLPPRVRPPARRVREIMQRLVYCAGEAEPIGEAARRMIEHHVHRLVVMRDGKPISVVSTRDLMRAVVFHHVEQPLRELMTAPVHAIDIGESIDAAVLLLADHDVAGIAVLDGEAPVGVFTRAEAIRAAALPADLRARAPVEEVASWQVLCLDASTPAFRAAARAIATRVRRVVVMEGGKLAGIVSGCDLAKPIATGG